jgi:hypothetical protein
MKFGKHLKEKVAAKFATDPKCSTLNSSMVRYKVFKKVLKSMDFAALKARRNEETSEECCICFEPFEYRSDAIRTHCGHLFHPYCLIDAFSVSNCQGNCPLCRFPVSKMIPCGLDGDILRFLAMVRVNINAADACHEKFVSYLQSLTKNLLTLVKAAEGLGHLLTSWGCGASKKQLADDAARLCELIAAAELFATANRDGFRKILKKFDRRSGAQPLSPHVLARLESRGFALDAAAGPGAGRLGELRRQLVAAFGPLPDDSYLQCQHLSSPTPTDNGAEVCSQSAGFVAAPWAPRA